MNIERLKELFEPDYDKGILIWKIKSNSNVPAGSLAGNTGRDGYTKVGIDNRYEYVHRVLWAMYHGTEPIATIDHIDGNPSNNSIGNLRELSQQQQSFNRGLYSNNSTGYKGVSFCKLTGLFRAEVKRDGKRVLDKRFKTAEEAHEVALAARATYHDGYAREATT